MYLHSRRMHITLQSHLNTPSRTLNTVIHIRWRMKRKAPGTTRSSLPTLHRRRKTTIPGISSSRSFRRPYLPSNRSRFSAIFNVGRDQTVPYPRITGRRELEPYSGISLKLETNASRLVEVVVAFRGAHFRNSVPVDRGFSPSSSRPNLSEISRALFPSNERAFDATTPHSGPPMKKLNHVGDLVWIDLQIIFQRWEREKTQSFSTLNSRIFLALPHPSHYWQKFTLFFLF